MTLTEKIMKASHLAQANEQLRKINFTFSDANPALLKITAEPGWGIKDTDVPILNLATVPPTEAAELNKKIGTALIAAIDQVIAQNEAEMKAIVGEEAETPAQSPIEVLLNSLPFSDSPQVKKEVKKVFEEVAKITRDKFREFTD